MGKRYHPSWCTVLLDHYIDFIQILHVYAGFVKFVGSACQQYSNSQEGDGFSWDSRVADSCNSLGPGTQPITEFPCHALALFMALFCWAILFWRASVTVATPGAVLTKPDTAALKAELVRVSTLVARRPRMVQVSIRRLVQVIMIERFPSSWSTLLRLPNSWLVFDVDLQEVGRVAITLPLLSS